MNIEQLQQEMEQENVAQTVPLRAKSGEPLLAADGSPATISVIGRYSTRVRAARDQQTERQIRRSVYNPPDARDVMQSRIALAAAGLVGWHGLEEHGEPWDYSPERAVQLLRVDYLLEQVEAAIADHGRKPAPADTRASEAA